MSFLKTSFFSGIGTAINLLSRLVTNKIIAVYLGTNGIFLMGQLRDFLKITSTASSLGTSNGLIKYIAEHKSDSQQLNNYLSSGFKIHLFASLVVAVFTILFKDFLSQYLFKTEAYSSFFIVLAFSLITMAIHSCILSILNGLKKIKQYVLITAISSIATAFITVIFVMQFDIEGALYALAVSQIIAFVISFLFIKFDHSISLSQFFLPIKKQYLKNLSKFSIMALVSPLFVVIATLFARNYVLDSYGENHAGSWEGMWRISAMYLLFITSTLKFYLLPTFSQLEGKALKKEIFKVWKFVLPAVILFVVVIYLLKEFLISTLFSAEFKLIEVLIGFHLIGDVLKIMSWILGNLIISKAKTKVFVFLQFEWSIVFIMLTIIFMNLYGFVGISIAYMCAYCIHFLIMNIYFRKLLWAN